MTRWLRPSLNWLLVLVPAAVLAERLEPQAHGTIFLLACGAVVPLAGWMGKATEHLADRGGAGLGGLLNATFGNAAELIIALVALQRGLTEVVKASLTGSILGNLLLVLGLSTLAGGLKHPNLKFNPAGARAQATMLTLAAIALIAPAGYHYLVGPGQAPRENSLSLEISGVLLVTYAASLVFALRTHRRLFEAPAAEAAAIESHGPAWSVRRSVLVLLGATALVAWMSEILVGSVEAAAHEFGMTSLFVGVVVVAIIGNAAEHSTAVLVARKNRMDLSLGIAIGSSIQIALFVAPVLVLLSHVLGPAPMDLVFTPAEVIALALAIAITGQVAGDGESHWLEGVQLLAVYAILALVFFFLPEPGVPVPP